MRASPHLMRARRAAGRPPTVDLPAVSRTTRLSLLALSLLLAILPLVLEKPGLPGGLKADEAAYYLMALSLAHDQDLRLTPDDVGRAFQEFPFGEIDNLIVMTDDGWRTVYYGKPYLYSLFGAPFAAVAGADGLLCFNLLLTLSMVWLGALYLARFNDDGLAALYSAGFFLASTGFAYAFWLHPEVFSMAAVAAACFLVFHGIDAATSPRRPLRLTWLAAASGVALAAAAYNKPVFAAIGLPLVVALAGKRRWRAAAGWVAGFALALGAAAGGAVALTGHPTPYLGVERMGVTLCEPGVMPVEPVPGGLGGPSAERPTGGAWSWIFHLPEVSWEEFAENLGYFLWGRHTGFLLYFPFAALAVLLFLLHGRRDRVRWLLLASLAAVALFFLLFIPHNWQGGGGFIGNRYFVNVVPAFLFLVTRLRPRALILAGFALAGLFLGPLLLSPFGRSVPEPTLQSHVRGRPYRFFPLELSLRELPGYDKRTVDGRSFLGRRDVVLPRGDALWLRGAGRSEIWISGGEPLGRTVFRVESAAAGNRVTLDLEGDRAELVFDRPGTERVELTPRRPYRVRRRGEARLYVYRLVVDASTGRIRPWRRWFPPSDCAYFAHNESWRESFFLGAVVTYLGGGEGLDRDVYAVSWGEISVPERVAAGAAFTVPTRLTNESGESWVAAGAARVELAYHWLTAAGEVAVWDGERTPLPLPVAPGAEVVVEQRILAPDEPGRYRLALDPVFEHVAWFSDRNGGRTYEAQIEVVPAGGGESGAIGEPAAAERRHPAEAGRAGEGGGGERRR